MVITDEELDRIKQAASWYKIAAERCERLATSKDQPDDLTDRLAEVTDAARRGRTQLLIVHVDLAQRTALLRVEQTGGRS